MAYVPVPKDLTKVKTKVMFNLTRRQLVCFTAGALVGVPLFLWLREPAGNSMAAICRIYPDSPYLDRGHTGCSQAVYGQPNSGSGHGKRNPDGAFPVHNGLSGRNHSDSGICGNLCAAG